MKNTKVIAMKKFVYLMTVWSWGWVISSFAAQEFAGMPLHRTDGDSKALIIRSDLQAIVKADEQVALINFYAKLMQETELNTRLGYKQQTVLHCAAHAVDNSDVIRRLLKVGFDATIVDCDGRTALHYAMMVGHFKAANILSMHTKLHAKDRCGKTALDYAQQPDSLQAKLLVKEIKARARK